jgi:hypothetical protein
LIFAGKVFIQQLREAFTGDLIAIFGGVVIRHGLSSFFRFDAIRWRREWDSLHQNLEAFMLHQLAKIISNDTGKTDSTLVSIFSLATRDSCSSLSTVWIVWTRRLE